MTGVHIRLDSPARLGDYIKLDRDDKGLFYANRLGVNASPCSPQQHRGRIQYQAGRRDDHEICSAHVIAVVPSSARTVTKRV
jgi:hypothetical protein